MIKSRSDFGRDRKVHYEHLRKLFGGIVTLRYRRC